MRSTVLEISDKVGGQSLQLETLKTEVFKLKEENSAQRDQISELRSKIDATRDSAEKAQAAQALLIANLTAEVKATVAKLAALDKTHSNTSQQLESLSTTVAKQEAKQEAAQQASSSASPFLRAANPSTVTTVQSSAPSPFLRATDIQWAGGEQATQPQQQQQQQQQQQWYGGEQQRFVGQPVANNTISLPIGPASSPSPMIRSIITHAPAPIMVSAPSQGWIGGQTQTLSTYGQTQTLSTYGQPQTLTMHPQGVITYR